MTSSSPDGRRRLGGRGGRRGGGRGGLRGRRGGGRGRGGGSLVDEPDDVVEGRVVAQLQAVVAGDPVGLADRREHLGLLDGVDPEVGLEVEVQVEQVGRVAGLLGDDREDARGDLLLAGWGRRPRRPGRPRRRGPGRPPRPARRRRGRGGGSLVDEPDDVVEGRVVAQLQAVVAGDPVGLADRREHLGLLDGVDPEVGLEVEVQVEQVGRVAGLLGDDREDAGGDLLLAGWGRRLGGRGGRCGAGPGRPPRPARRRARARRRIARGRTRRRG